MMFQNSLIQLTLLTFCITAGAILPLDQIRRYGNMEDGNSIRANGLIKVLKKMFIPVAPLDISVQVESNNYATQIFLRDSLDAMLQNNENEFTIQLSINQHKDKTLVYNFWIVDSYASFLKIYEHAEKHNRNIAGSYVIMLINLNRSVYLHFDFVRSALKKMHEINVVNAKIWLKLEGDRLDMYTYLPYTEQHCNKVEPMLTNRFQNGALQNKVHLPQTTNNFHNCTMKVFSWNMPPFLIFAPLRWAPPKTTGFEKNKKKVSASQSNVLQSISKVSGFEAELLQTISKALNFSVQIVTDPTLTFGEVTATGNMSGPFAMVEQRKVDILMGNFFYSPPRVLFLSETRSYMTSHLWAIVKSCGEKCYLYRYSDWILQPFSWGSWILISLYTIIVFSMVLILTPVGQRLQTSFHLVATALGSAQPLHLSLPSYRFTVSVWCAGFIILRSAYQGKIYDSYRTEHYRKPPVSFDELIMQNYNIYSGRVFNDSSTNFKITSIILTKRSVYKVLEADPSDKAAALVNSANLMYSLSIQKKYDIFERIAQPLYMQQLCAYFKRHSYLSKAFDEVIMRLISSGIVTKWAAKFNLASTRIVVPIGKTTALRRAPTVMTLLKLKWVFYVDALLLAISGMVFLLELLVAWWFNKNRSKYPAREGSADLG